MSDVYEYVKVLESNDSADNVATKYPCRAKYVKICVLY
jgi:hypothetical protein